MEGQSGLGRGLPLRSVGLLLGKLEESVFRPGSGRNPFEALLRRISFHPDAVEDVGDHVEGVGQLAVERPPLPAQIPNPLIESRKGPKCV